MTLSFCESRNAAAVPAATGAKNRTLDFGLLGKSPYFFPLLSALTSRFSDGRLHSEEKNNMKRAVAVEKKAKKGNKRARMILSLVPRIHLFISYPPGDTIGVHVYTWNAATSGASADKIELALEEAQQQGHGTELAWHFLEADEEAADFDEIRSRFKIEAIPGSVYGRWEMLGHGSYKLATMRLWNFMHDE